MSDIPTALSEREGKLLRKLGHGKKVIEIGSLFGYSTLQLAHRAKQVISIDPHEGYPEPNAPSTWKEFLNNIKGKNVVPIKDIYQNVDLPAADLAFIDINGKYETTKDCLKRLDHVPLIIVHDFKRQNCKGVEKAIVELERDIKVVDSCVILT